MNEKLPPGVLTLPEMLKAGGIYTAVIGKLFHKIDYAERQLATFDRIEMYEKAAGVAGTRSPSCLNRRSGPSMRLPAIRRPNAISRPRTLAKESENTRIATATPV